MMSTTLCATRGPLDTVQRTGRWRLSKYILLQKIRVVRLPSKLMEKPLRLPYDSGSVEERIGKTFLPVLKPMELLIFKNLVNVQGIYWTDS